MRNLLSLLFLSVALQGCGIVQEPTVALKSASIQNVSSEKVAATFAFTVDNPNPVAIDLARLSYDLAINGKTVVTSGSAPVAVHLPALGPGELSLPVELAYADVATSAVGIVLGGGVRYELSMVLGVQTPNGMLDVPVMTSGNFASTAF